MADNDPHGRGIHFGIGECFDPEKLERAFLEILANTITKTESDLEVKSAGDNLRRFIGDSNRTAADAALLILDGEWNGTKVAQVRMESGDDTSNKDDGRITFWVAAAGSVAEVARIEPDGDMVIGATSIAATAIFELASTTKGFLPPRMTTTERDNISSPATGLVIYNTTTNKLNLYTGSAWEAVTSA